MTTITVGDARRFFEAAAALRDSATDQQAANAVGVYRKWIPGDYYAADMRLQYNNRLYVVLQAHTSQADWTPDITTSLYTEICADPEAGTLENPIQYNKNMELILGLYYVQFEVIYLCIRSTEQPVYNDLADLVGIYVEIATENNGESQWKIKHRNR